MRTVATGLVASALFPLLAGCGGDSAPSALPAGPGATGAGPGRAGSTPPVATSTAGDPVLVAYLRFWDAVIAAHRAADARSPGLAAVAGDPQLTRVRQAVSRNRIQRLSLRGTVGHQVRPSRTSGDAATLEDCYDISAWDPVDLRTGKPVEVTDESGTGRYRARYTLRRAGSTWRVVDQVALGGC
jgi:hypothetical protein